MELLLQVIWFLAPAGAANFIPPIAAKLAPRWNTPMDFGLTLRGQRVFGSHKTIRGLFCGVLLATVVHQVQIEISNQLPAMRALAIEESYLQYWWLGPWLGFIALMGDAIKSFFKRQFGIAPGKAWLPWDKIDWVLGTLAGSAFFFTFDIKFVTVSLVAGLTLSFVARAAGYWLKINSSWI